MERLEELVILAPVGSQVCQDSWDILELLEARALQELQGYQVLWFSLNTCLAVVVTSLIQEGLFLCQGHWRF